MRKLKIALGVVLALAAAAAAAFPWYLGWETEQRFIAGLSYGALGKNAPVAVSLIQYDRGWLHSNAIHRVSLKADPEMHFDVHHAIRHLPGLDKSLVAIHSTPRWPDKVQAAADYYFANKPAVSVNTVVRLDRSMSMAIESPAFSKPMLAQPEIKLSWGGATGQMSLGEPAQINLAFDLPRVAFEGGGLAASFAGMKVQADWDATGEQVDWSGETRMSIGELSLSSAFGAGSLKGVESAVVQRNQGQTVLVGYSLKVREGVATERGAEQQGFKDAVLDVEFDRLDKKALAKYFDDLAGAEHAPISRDAQSRLVGQLALGMMSELLKASPEVRVNKLGMHTADGAISGSAVLSFDGKGLTQAAAPGDLLARVKFTGSAELSSTLVQAWLAKQAHVQAASTLAQGGASVEEAQVQTLTQQLAQQQLAALQASGLIKVEGDKFVIRAEFAGGKLSINGMSGDHFLPALLPPTQPRGDDQEALVGEARDRKA